MALNITLLVFILNGGEIRVLDDEGLGKKFKSFSKKLKMFCMTELGALGHKSAIENRVL